MNKNVQSYNNIGGAFGRWRMSNKQGVVNKLKNLLEKNPEKGKLAINALIAFKDCRKNSTIEEQNIALKSLDALPIDDTFPTKIELMELVRNTSYFVQRNLPDTFKDFLNGLRTTDQDTFNEVTKEHTAFLQNSGVNIQQLNLFEQMLKQSDLLITKDRNQYGQDQQIEQNTKLLQNSRVDVLKLKDALGKEVSSEIIALHWGKHNIVLHGEKKGTTTSINTDSHIYFFSNVQLGTMKKSAHCIVMNQSDFDRIKKNIHSGAFGGDYCKIKGNLVVVWKHPADLLSIEGYRNPDKVPLDVGTYGFCDDTNDTVDFFKPPIQGDATKLRIDCYLEEEGTNVVSVHQFLGKTTGNGDKFNLPAIATANFFNNFGNPQEEERKNVNKMIEELKKLGIYAFSSNASHHAVVLYAYEKEGAEKQPLTPNILATLLKDNPSILDVISKAALKGKDMRQWKNAFINVFINE